MDKGDLFTVYMDGNVMTICVLGSYNEEYTGEEIVILAIVNQDNMVHIPVTDLNMLFPRKKYIN
ncbi:MAG: hypothetical protein VB084_12330 [Syntrophomonadaceae bacterium]|nr:hypothetical protein [Syntrophomonadaceae bacterium]